MPGARTHLYVHIVFSTKRREPLIDDDFAEELHPFLGGIARDLRCTPHTIGGIPDHVHLLIRQRSDISISDLVRHLKGRSARWANERRAGSLKWQEGYGAFSVSKSGLAEVVEYINNQKSHHQEMTYKQEFEAFLKRNQIEFDPKELWSDED